MDQISKKINAIARGNQRSLIKISDLEINHPYVIENMRKIKTQFGVKVIVELESDIYCYLPSRVSKALLENEEEGLTEFKERLTLAPTYLRRTKEADYNPIEFLIALPNDQE